MRNKAEQNDKHEQEFVSIRLLLFMLRVSVNAKKNPEMNRLRFSNINPLWLFRFFFKSVNVPSILLFVFGIPLQSSRWKVNK
jgi:hypothetical protein